MKKLLILFFVLFIGITLTSCDDKTKYNTNVPTGNLGDTVYASLGELSITEKELYNEMRSSAYSIFINEIANLLIPNNLSKTDSKTLEELKELINEDCYGTTELDDLTSEEKTEAETAFVDNMKLLDVTCEIGNIYTDSCLDYYLPTLAQKKYAESLIRDENSKYYYKNEFQKENGEELTDDNGEQIENPYYISEEDIENYYTTNYQDDVEFKAIILGFRTLADLENALGSNYVDGKVVTDNADALFNSLFEKVYGYKDANNHVLKDEDVASLNSTLITTLENLGEGNYTVYPQQVGDLVYLLYSIEEKDVVEYADLEGEELTKVNNDITEEIIENYITSSFVSSSINEALTNADITIYDPVFDALFATSYADHTRLENKEWSNDFNQYVAKVNDKYLTVADFYNTLEARIGVTTTMDYFINKVLLASDYADDITKDDLDDIKEKYEAEIKKFEAGSNSSYPAAIGVDNFKFLYYGSTNEDDIYDYYKAQLVWELKLADYPENFFEIVEKFGKNYYNNYFDLSVKHVLFFVDYDMDGTPDNPTKFLNKLSTEKQTEFKNALVALMNAYLSEVHYLVEEKEYASLVEALTFVEKEYIKGSSLHSDSTKTWNDYKKFNIGIKVEDLGAVNNETESKYVPEFGEGVQALYKELKAKDGYDLGDDYIHESVAEADLTNPAKVIETTYGYHILGVYDSEELTDAKYTASNDSTTDPQYKEVKVKWNGVEETVDAYSEELWPSQNQLKIYFSQALNKQTIKKLPSDVKNYIATIYTTVMDRYENSDFQNIYLAHELLDEITYTNTANKTKFDEFLAIQQRQLDSYEDYSTSSDKVLAGWWEEFLA